MSKITKMFAGAVLLAALLAGSAPAGAAAPESATVLGPVRIDPADASVGYVTARYLCYGGEGSWLWVSVKQMADGRPDNRLKEGGSSELADTWLQRHHGDAVTCDGTWQTQTFTVDLYPEGQWAQGKGSLVPGQAYVQFCLYSPESDEDGATFQNFRAVR